MIQVDSRQLFLLRWIEHPPDNCFTRSYVFLQHHLGGHGQGSRAIKFLPRGSESPQALLANIPYMYHYYCWNDYHGNTSGTTRMADYG